MPPAPAKGSRRSSSQNRQLLLDAARELFETNGYGATTTKQITDHAGVVESTLFRHFGSKVELFKATVVEPFTTVFYDWIADWQTYPLDAPIEDSMDLLVGGLAKVVYRNRNVLMSLMVAEFQGDGDLAEVAVDVRRQFAASVEAVRHTGLDLVSSRQLASIDPPVTVANTFGLVLGTILHSGWLFAEAEPHPDEERVIKDMVSMAVHGISHRPPAPHTAAGPSRPSTNGPDAATTQQGSPE